MYSICVLLYERGSCLMFTCAQVPGKRAGSRVKCSLHLFQSPVHFASASEDRPPRVELRFGV